MKIQTLFGIAIATAALAVMPARAAVLTESFTFTGSVYSVAGNFTYDQSSGQLQSISGDVVTAGVKEGITGLVTGSSPFFPVSGNDNGFNFSNLFDSATQTFLLDGILFAFGSANFGNLYFDPYSSNPAPFLSTWLPDGAMSPSDCSKGDLYCPGDTGTIEFAAVSPVPELSTWAMMLLGFLGIGFLGRGRLSPEARRQLVTDPRQAP